MCVRVEIHLKTSATKETFQESVSFFSFLKGLSLKKQAFFTIKIKKKELRRLVTIPDTPTSLFSNDILCTQKYSSIRLPSMIIEEFKYFRNRYQ